jgi:tetratricopeptide (TPR) repeat protein
MAQVSGKVAPVEQSQILIAGAKNAMALHAQGDLSAAEMQYAVVVPFVQHPGLYAGYASLLIATGRAAQGEKWLRRTLALYPDHPLAVALPGATGQQAERWEEAEKWLRRRLCLGGDVAATEAGLGVALTRQGKFAEGATCCAAAVRRRPEDADFRFNLAVAVEKTGALSDALTEYRRAITLHPAFSAALSNAARCATRMGATQTAKALYDRLISLNPQDMEARFWRGNLRVALGDWIGGWTEYEARLQVPRLASRDRRAGAIPGMTPLWNGSPIPHATLVLMGEQGLGDVLMFSRFLPLAAARAGRIVVQAHARLAPLLDGQFPGVTVQRLGAPCSADFWLPIMSLPHVLGLDVGDLPRGPYISAPAAEVERRRRDIAEHPPFQQRGGRTVGLNWAGSPAYLYDADRSPGLAPFLPLLEVPGWNPVALQFGDGRDDLARITTPDYLLDLGPAQASMTDAVAIATALDLVITSDTALVHAGGAAGQEFWLVQSAHADWRWVEHEEGVSLWYPTVRIFRQRTPGLWDDVIAEIRQALLSKP